MVDRGVVIVHAGAGYHSHSKEMIYRNLCAESAKKAIDILLAGGSASQAAVAATKILEDSPLTNAGIGSSLTIDGTVECDAALLTSQGGFGSVGALSGVLNPILVAEKLTEHQLQPSKDGRVPPCLLVSDGAKQFAIEKKIPTTDPDAMVIEHTSKSYKKYKSIVDRNNGCCQNETQRRKRRHSDELTNPGGPSPKVSESVTLDTVGVICMDGEKNMAAAMSSGGIALKRRGRLGQVCVNGCGGWIEGRTAAVTSGCGEQIIRTGFARSIVQKIKIGETDSDSIPSSHLYTAITSEFLEHPHLKQESLKLMGAVVLHEDSSGQVEIMFSHTTRSMALAFMSTEDLKPTSLVSRLDNPSLEGKSCVVQGHSVSFALNREPDAVKSSHGV